MPAWVGWVIGVALAVMIAAGVLGAIGLHQIDQAADRCRAAGGYYVTTEQGRVCARLDVIRP